MPGRLREPGTSSVSARVSGHHFVVSAMTPADPRRQRSAPPAGDDPGRQGQTDILKDGGNPMSKSQFADRRFFAPVEEETVAPMTALAGKPGGAALLWRWVWRGPHARRPFLP